MADSASPFLDLVRRRTSCRQFDPDRPVPKQAILQCLEAARLAPSACNQQPWRFIIVDDPSTRQAFFDQARLPGIPHTWWQTVPVFVVVCCQRNVVTHRLASFVSGLPYAWMDTAIAAEHFVLAAAELGLGTCWIGWFHEKRVKKLLAIPSSVRVAALIALGYPPDSVPPTNNSPRKPIETIAAWNSWSEPE